MLFKRKCAYLQRRALTTKQSPCGPQHTTFENVWSSSILRAQQLRNAPKKNADAILVQLFHEIAGRRHVVLVDSTIFAVRHVLRRFAFAFAFYTKTGELSRLQE